MEGVLIGLVALACPIGMGLMMWFMSKGMRGSKNEYSEQQESEPSLAELQAEHERLGAEIARLDDRDPQRDGVPSGRR